MANNKESDQGEESEKGGKNKLLLFGGVGVLVLLLGGGGAFFLLGGKDDEAAADEVVEDVIQPVLYHALEPKFVVNVEDQGRQRFMQIAISAKTRDPEAVTALSAHDPLIRSRLNLLLGAQKYETMNTLEGKETLQKEVFEAVQKVLNDEADGLLIEDILFTELVLQ